MKKPTISLIGAGRVGATLALAAHRAGYPLQAIFTRTPSRAASLADRTGASIVTTLGDAIDLGEWVFVAVPDDAIAEIDAAGAGHWRSDMAVIHFSGAQPADILVNARREGALVAAFHPLQSISDLESGLRNLPGTTFGISGDAILKPQLIQLARDLQGYALSIPDDAKVLYHAAAVFVSNFPVILYAQGVRILNQLGIPAKDAERALLPLIQGAVANLAEPGLPQALTGPLSRGDAGIIASHRAHLQATFPDLDDLYRLISQAGLDLVRDQGNLDEATLARLQRLLSSETSE